jgi:hypothetical protein
MNTTIFLCFVIMLAHVEVLSFTWAKGKVKSGIRSTLIGMEKDAAYKPTNETLAIDHSELKNGIAKFYDEVSLNKQLPSHPYCYTVCSPRRYG